MSVYTEIKKFTKSNQGFTLIEVLIGVFIAAIGVVGVLEIQKHVIRSGNEVNARTIATQLVRDKLDTINNVDAFADVGITPAPANENIDKRNYSFTRTWQMTAYHFDNDTNAWGGVGAGESTDAKHVTVSVSWTDINNEIQTVNGDQIIASTSIHDTSGLANTSGNRTSPLVPFNTLSSIENPPISLIDDTMDITGVTVNTKETSKPIPTVYGHNNSNLIQFETVVYDPDADTQTLEDFATVNCSCSFNGTTDDGAKPSLLRLSDDESSLVNDVTSGRGVDGDLGITKVTGVTTGTQAPKLCDKCCADHHDSSSASAKYVAGSISRTASGNHLHYNAALTDVTTGDYIEACRFRRIDGFYQLVPDWHLVDIITMPESFFYTTANVTAYTSYVKSVVKLCVQFIDDCYSNTLTFPAKPENRDLVNIVPGSQQLISRGIYVDTASINRDDLSEILGYVSTKANWLEYIPFYEINLTLFSDWISSYTNAVTVTTDEINTITDTSQGYYGTYSRGRITAQPETGTSDVRSSNNIDNTGITGSGKINPDVVYIYDTVNITVNGTPAEGDNSILIEINCQKYNNQNVLGGCQPQDTVNVTFIVSPSTITCSYSKQQGNNTAFLTCNAVPDWTGTIDFSNLGYTFGDMTCDGMVTTGFALSGSMTEVCSIVMTENTP